MRPAWICGTMGMAAKAGRREGTGSHETGDNGSGAVKGFKTERHLKLEELAAATKISKSALGSYENDELKEISHKNLVELAKFYGVSTDYLLCLTENRNHPDTGLTELHLSDDMVELLKSGRINNRLLCEIATHEDFITLMTDTEIYVDGVATSHFQNFNSLLEVLRGQVLSQYQPVEEDTALKALIFPVQPPIASDGAVLLRQLQIRDVVVAYQNIINAVLCDSFFQFFHCRSLLWWKARHRPAQSRP